MATSPLHAHISTLFSELAEIISAAAGPDTEAVTTADVVGELSSQLRELSGQIGTYQDLQTYMNIASFPHPSVPDASLALCHMQVRSTLQRFVRHVALCEPDAEPSYRLARVFGGLEYAQKHVKEYLASAQRSRASGSTAAALPASRTPAAPFNTPPYAHWFGNASHAGGQLQLQYPSAGSVPWISGPVPPPLLHISPSPSPPWSSPLSTNPFAPSLGGRYTNEELELLEGLLASENTLCGLHARSMGEDTWHEVRGAIDELVLLKGSYDLVSADIPTVSMLCDVAPNVSRLSIDMPIAPSISESSPALRFLLIDEGDHAVWSTNWMAATLDALRAAEIPELHIRNAAPATLRKCMAYLEHSTSCIIVDDDDVRFVNMADRQHAHTYSGASIAGSRLVYKNNALEGLVSLTVCDQMVSDELDELFGRAFPPRLKDLRIWFGARYCPMEARGRLLAYRKTGWGRCEALEKLVLTSTPPLDLIDSRGATAIPRVRRSEMNVFLYHIHGGNCTAMLNVQIVQDGVDVVDD